MASLKQDDKSSRFFCLFPPICRRRGEIDEKGDLDSEKTADFRKILLKFKCGIRKAPALTYHQSNIVSFCLIYHFFCLFRVEGNWFVNQDMLLCSGCLEDDRVVEMVWEGDNDGLNLFVAKNIFMSRSRELCSKTPLRFFSLLFIHIGHSDEIHVILQILNSSEMGLCNPSTTDDPKSNLSIGHLSFLLWFLLGRDMG